MSAVPVMALWQALNAALRAAMDDDPRVFILGEEITNWGSGGGLYGVTQGLLDQFGATRVRDTPLSEAGVLYAAIGAALTGMRPIVDLNYSDFALLAMDAIVNQAAKYRYMFAGQFDVPLVLRANTGAAKGKGAQHSQSIETLFAHVPGLEVALPSTPDDAFGLLRSAIASPNPTVFLEHKALYATRGAVSGAAIPLGVATVVRPGHQLTIIATQLMVHYSLRAAQRLADEGISAEVIDLRTLSPLDMDTVFRSVRRTRHALVCHEAPQLFGFGGEIAAAIMRACWAELDAPVERLGGEHTPIPFAPHLEAAVLPSEESIAAAVRALVKPLHSIFARHRVPQS